MITAKFLFKKTKRKREDSCSSLRQILEKVIKWYSTSDGNKLDISCIQRHLGIVKKYSSEVQVGHTLNIQMYRLSHNKYWRRRYRHKPGSHYQLRVIQLLRSFLRDLGEVFKVPKPSGTDNNFTQIELVAGFITFLIQLANPHPCCFVSNYFPDLKYLVMELRFLVTILGDSPFQAAEPKHVWSILNEFEQVANEAGALVHLVVFGLVTYLEAMNGTSVLLEHIEFLKTNIIKFLDRLPTSVIAHRANSPVDSLFIVDSLLHYIKDLLNQDDDPLVYLKDLIKMFHEQLILCRPLLRVPVQCTEIEELMKESMLQIISVTYDVEYLIKSFLVGDAPRWYLVMRLTRYISSIQINAAKLQEKKQDYDIVDLEVADAFNAQQWEQAKKDSLVDDVFVDFYQQKTKTLDQLQWGPKKLQLIFIVGMAGIGKTTLAKKLYNDSMVGHHFDKISWCVVSQVHQSKNLLIDILISIGSDLKYDKIQGMEDSDLGVEMYKCLKDRRYLIVMDDIWNSEVWDVLCRFFPNDENGSRILFTSRNKDLAPSGSIINELPLLSQDLCLELLQKMIFHDNPCPPPLLEIGKKIASGCYGLPLAVVVVAGVLSTLDKEERTWETVRQSLECHELSNRSNSMMQILELSYKHLPFYLKPCFLYFGVFREDARICVRELTQLWIAEGFIPKEENKRAEVIAEKYLMELIDKSLVMVTKRRSDGGPKFCIIHDLVREMCLTIAQKENFLKWSDDDKMYKRLCVHMRPLYQPSSPCLAPYGHRPQLYFFSFPESLLSILNMKLLRVFNCQRDSDYDLLKYYAIVDHLRYLSTVCFDKAFLQRLVNLEFLIVDAVDTVHIPSSILKMVKLRYMACWAYFDNDCDTSQTSNLEYLSMVWLCSQKDLEMLKCFPILRTLKCACKDTLKCFDIHFLIELESLKVWSRSLQIDEIKFPSGIRKLTLEEMWLPRERMRIIGSMPHLEVLKLEDDTFEGERWDTSNGEFLQLRILRLSKVDLVQWNVSSNKHFPRLRQLSLDYCYRLEVIPSEIGEIETLQLIEVRRKCRKSLVQSAAQIQKEQLEFGNEEFSVDVRYWEEVN